MIKTYLIDAPIYSLFGVDSLPIRGYIALQVEDNGCIVVLILPLPLSALSLYLSRPGKDANEFLGLSVLLLKTSAKGYSCEGKARITSS